MENKETPGRMGPTKSRTIWDKNKDKYVFIVVGENRCYSGKIVDFKEGIVTLNPHQGADYHPELGLMRKLKEKAS